jgi:peptide/nickel transport system permease protein
MLAGGSVPNPETLAAIREQFRLDDPVWLRYLSWLQDLLTGNLGKSYVFRTDIASLIIPRAGTSLLLVAYSAVIILVLGIGLGILAALGNKTTDRFVSIFSSIAMGAPTFVVAILLITVFALYLDWFPIYGKGTDFLDQLRHLTLPAVAMSCAYFAFVARITRTAVRAEMHSEHVDTARSRGIPRRSYIPRHVLRNSSTQILSVSGITIAGLFASTAVAEQAFGIGGLGSLLVEAAARQDLPVVQVLSLLLVAAFVLINTSVDLVNTALDPRAASRTGGLA